MCSQQGVSCLIYLTDTQIIHRKQCTNSVRKVRVTSDQRNPEMEGRNNVESAPVHTVINRGLPTSRLLQPVIHIYLITDLYHSARYDVMLCDGRHRKHAPTVLHSGILYISRAVYAALLLLQC